MWANENKTHVYTHINTTKQHNTHHKFKSILSRGINMNLWFGLICSILLRLTTLILFYSFPVDLMWSMVFWRQIEYSVQSTHYHPNMNRKGKQATIKHVIQMFLGSDANESFAYFIPPMFFPQMQSTDMVVSQTPVANYFYD